jgi:hypothetical protein
VKKAAIKREIPADIRQVIVRSLGAALAEARAQRTS